MRLWGWALAALCCGCGGGGPAAKRVAPAALVSFRTTSADCGQAAGAGDWNQAMTLLATAQTNWTAVAPELAAARPGLPAPAAIDMIDQALGSLASDLQAHRTRAAETDANQVELWVPDLLDLYLSSVPTDVLRLDAQFRALSIDGAYSDWTPSAADALEVATLWNRVRSTVAGRAAQRPDVAGASTLVADLDSNVAASMSAVNARDGITLDARTLDGRHLVRIIEELFE